MSNEHRLKSKTITIAESDVVDTYEKIAAEFFPAILDMSYYDCLITDESCLSDFSTCGMDDLDTEGLSYEGVVGIWRKYIVEKVNSRYQIIVSHHDYLIHIFEQIKQRHVVQ